MSDTPMTDKHAMQIGTSDSHTEVVWADFARKLERENATLHAALVEYHASASIGRTNAYQVGFGKAFDMASAIPSGEKPAK